MEALANLGIDLKGVVLYIVNFGILMALLYRFAYKPLLAMLDKRRDIIRDNIEEAERLRKEFETKAVEEASLRGTREAELDARIAKAKKVAKDDAKKLISDAQAQRDAMLAAANKAVEEAMKNTIKGSEEEILKRVRAVVSSVLQGGVSEAEIKKSVDESWKKLAKV